MELDAMNETAAGVAQAAPWPERPKGKFTARWPGPGAGRHDAGRRAIVVDRSVTTGRGFFLFSAGAPPATTG